ncbi:ABC transporter ATP-binding protein [Spirochaetia bacterium]|nr:ABC transporter ATP-binding protein [Spirochaetia bacterium]
MTIELQDVCCGYGKKEILTGFSTTISSGDIFCLLGPNGIGKTTLFKTILGFLPLLGGSITINDGDGPPKNIAELSHQELARCIGYVPQSHVPPFSFRTIDVIVMGRMARMGAFEQPREKDYTAAWEIMEQLGILTLGEQNYTELSGGERQMALIARALAQEPGFLMMDEPTSNLDFGNQAVVLRQILKLAGRNLGIIMTTHYPEHVLLLNSMGSTRVALLKRKGTICEGRARDILTGANLSETYGVGVAVMDVPYNDTILPFCQPILTEEKIKRIKENER